MKNKTELQKIFFTAIEENNIDKVKKLIQEGIDVNEKNIYTAKKNSKTK